MNKIYIKSSKPISQRMFWKSQTWFFEGQPSISLKKTFKTSKIIVTTKWILLENMVSQETCPRTDLKTGYEVVSLKMKNKKQIEKKYLIFKCDEQNLY